MISKEQLKSSKHQKPHCHSLTRRHPTLRRNLVPVIFEARLRGFFFHPSFAHYTAPKSVASHPAHHKSSTSNCVPIHGQATLSRNNAMEDAPAPFARLAAAMSAEQPGLPRPKKRQRTDTQEDDELEGTETYTHGQDSNATAHPSTPSPTIDASKRFLETLMSIIFAARALQQAQDMFSRAVTEKKKFEERMDYLYSRKQHLRRHPDLEHEDERRDELWETQCDLEKCVEELVAAVEARKARLDDLGALPKDLLLPQCLRDSSDFQRAYDGFACTLDLLRSIEDGLTEYDLEKKKLMDDKIDSHAQMVARSLEQARANGTEGNVAEEEHTHLALSELNARCIGSVAWDQHELKKSRLDYKHCLPSRRDAMVKHAERAMVREGFLPSLTQELEGEHQRKAPKVDAGPARKEVPPAKESAPTHESEGKPHGARDLQAELDAAQEQLRRLRLELDGRQQESKGEAAGLSWGQSRQEIAGATALKLIWTTSTRSSP